MKINMGQKNEDENKEYDYMYSNYKPVSNNTYYPKHKGPSFKWLFQLLISGVVFLLIVGLLRFDGPYSATLKSGVNYLFTSETDVQPVFYKVIQLASQLGNLEWPVMEGTVGPVQPAVQEVVTEEPVLHLPLSGNVIKEYGWAIDPVDGVKVFHEGIDIAAPAGTLVKASIAGTVLKIGELPELGKYVLVEIETGEIMRYANLAEVAVKKEQAVKTGAILGKTGKTEGVEPHLHFEVIIDGQPVDPLEKLK